MADPSTLQLAIAGGTGAFAGATIGNAIQVVRDWFNARRAQKNREQDLRREAYTSVFPKLLQLRVLLKQLESNTSLAMFSSELGANPDWYERAIDLADEAARCGADLLAEMQSRTLGYASEKIYDAVEDLSYNSYLWEASVHSKVMRPVEEGMFSRLLSEGVAPEVAIEQFSNPVNLREETRYERVVGLHGGAKFTLAQVGKLLHQMRAEIGLAIKEDSEYVRGRPRPDVDFQDLFATPPKRRRTTRIWRGRR